MPKAHWAIQLIQVSQSRFNEKYIPYASGLLQAYAMRYTRDPNRYTFLPYLTERLPLQQSLAQVLLADVYGFSVYVWNIEYCLALAQEIKLHKPDALIIFGGPQVPNQSEVFLRKYPFVDVCVHGEGERVFLQLLESLPDCDWEAIPGISWIDPQKGFQTHPRGPRIDHLDEIPSPYILGLFESLYQRTEYRWVVIWETNRGCPFSCTYCDWGSATAAKVKCYSLERIQQEIDWFVDHEVHVLSLCDANFGILKRDLEITDYLIEAHQRTGFVSVFFMLAAKNVTERSYQIHQKLTAAGISNFVSLAMQSLSSETLKSVRRENISLETYRELHARFSQAGVPTDTDILVGLPGETYDSFVAGVCQLISEGQHDWINFYNVYMLPNSELSQPAYRRRYGLETALIPYTEPWFGLEQEVPEWLEMVIASDSMPRPDWCRARAFAWLAMILLYNFKLLQIPLLVLHKVACLPWQTILSFFSDARFESAPILLDLHRFLLQKAQSLQQGQPLNCLMTQGAENQWYDVENFVVNGLSSPQVAQAFFGEAAQVLEQLLRSHGDPLPPDLLRESLQLSENLFLCPIRQQPFEFIGRYNLWPVYKAWLRGYPAQIRLQPCRYVRDWFTEPLFDVRVEKLPMHLTSLTRPSFSNKQP